MNVSRPDFRSQLLVYRNFGTRVVRLLFYWSQNISDNNNNICIIRIEVITPVFQTGYVGSIPTWCSHQWRLIPTMNKNKIETRVENRHFLPRLYL